MSSATWNCIGLGQERNGQRRIYQAMNKAEIMQQRHVAGKNGDRITEWYAQTPTGGRVLRTTYSRERMPDSMVRGVPMVTCPYCHGRGQNGTHYCPVCNGSGLMKPGNDKQWQQWQLDSMKAEAEEADKVTA
jgi:hypothetical protein